MVPWSSGMIPPLQGGDHEFESRRLHSVDEKSTTVNIERYELKFVL